MSVNKLLIFNFLVNYPFN